MPGMCRKYGVFCGVFVPPSFCQASCDLWVLCNDPVLARTRLGELHSTVTPCNVLMYNQNSLVHRNSHSEMPEMKAKLWGRISNWQLNQAKMQKKLSAASKSKKM